MDARLLATTRRLCRERAEGFFVKELEEVVELLGKLEARAMSLDGDESQEAEGPASEDFSKALCDVLEVLRKPFLRQKANEELLPEGRKALVVLVKRVSELLVSNVHSVPDAAIKSLYAIAQPPPRSTGTDSLMDLRQSPKDFAQDLLLSAGALEDLVVQYSRRVTLSEATSARAGNKERNNEEVPKSSAVEQPETTVEGPTSAGDDDGVINDVVGSKETPMACDEPVPVVPESTSAESSIEDLNTSWAPETSEAASVPGQQEEKEEIARPETLGNSFDLDAETDTEVATEGESESQGSQVDKASLVEDVSYPGSYLRCICELSRRQKCAAALAAAGCVRPLVQGLKTLLARRDVMLEVAIETLWNLCDASEQAIEDLAHIDHIAVLRFVLEELFREGYRAQDKNLRNQVLIIVSLLARNAKSHQYFLEAGLLPLLLVYATAGEVGVDQSMLRKASDSSAGNALLGSLRNFCTTDLLDIEMRRLLWTLLGTLSAAGSDGLALIASSAFCDALLVYLESVGQDMTKPGSDAGPPSRASSYNFDGFERYESSPGGLTTSWQGSPQSQGDALRSTDMTMPTTRPLPAIVQRLHITDLRQLQQCAMSILLTFAPRAPQSFLKGEGHIIMLRFIQALSIRLENCVRSTPEAVDVEKLLRLALMVLIAIVASGALQAELGELGGLDIMLQRAADDSAPPELRADAVTILGWLCHDNRENQDSLRDLGGIRPLIRTIQDFTDAHRNGLAPDETTSVPTRTSNLSSTGAPTKKTESTLLPNAKPALPPALLIRTLDCLWSCIIGNEESEKRFIEAEGVDIVLELLEVCMPIQRRQVLSFVADLLDNPRAVSVFKSWRSDRSKGISAVTLVLRIWVEEEARLGCSRTAGVLQNIEAPLRPCPLDQLPVEQKDAPNEFANDDEQDDDEDWEEDDLGNHVTEEENSASQAFSRLSEALAAAAKVDPEKVVAANVETLDLRGNAAAVLERVGWEESIKLLKADSPEEQTMIMVKFYLDFMRREAWGRVKTELEDLQCKPIASDRKEMEIALETGLDIAKAARTGQQAFAGAAERSAADLEQAFFAGIILQRDQEIYQLRLKKTSIMPKTLMRRKAQKEAKEKILAAASSVGSLASSTDSNEDADAVAELAAEVGSFVDDEEEEED